MGGVDPGGTRRRFTGRSAHRHRRLPAVVAIKIIEIARNWKNGIIDEEKSRGLGINALISKPIELPVLAETVRRSWMEKQRQTRRKRPYPFRIKG